MGSRRALTALGMALLLTLAATEARGARTTTFLDLWLTGQNPLRLGGKTFVHKQTGAKLHLLSTGPNPDLAVKAYRNRKKGDTIFSRTKGSASDQLVLRTESGKYVRVPEADYEELPAQEVMDLNAKSCFIVPDDYEEAPAASEALPDVTVFLPITGPIVASMAVRNFEDGAVELARLRPGCVVVMVDTEGGVISLAETLCNAISLMRRQGIRTFAYINGEKRGAYSAGALIALACERIVMAPGTVMGAATPVAMSPATGTESLTGDVRDKAVSAFAAHFRALAGQANFPPALAAAMVDKDLGVVEVKIGDKRSLVSARQAQDLKQQAEAEKRAATERIICPAGRPATITAEEAAAVGALLGIANSPAELAALVNPQGKRLAVYEPVDKFSLRIKPVMAKIEPLMQRVNQAAMGMSAAQTARDFVRFNTEAVRAIDEILRLTGRYRDIFTEEDEKPLRDMRSGFLGLRNAVPTTTP